MNIEGFKPQYSDAGLEMIHEKCGNPSHFGTKAEESAIKDACELHVLICEMTHEPAAIGVQIGNKTEGDLLAEKLIDIGNRWAVAGAAELELVVSPKQRNLILSVLKAKISCAIHEAALFAMIDMRDSMMKTMRER